MKTLSLLILSTLMASIAGPALAQRAIEGIDKDTYDRNTMILQQNREGYQKHHDFYYDYKYSDIDYDVEEKETTDYNDSFDNDSDEDDVIKGGF